MRTGRMAGMACIGVLIVAVCAAADWPHWRGPAFSGVAPSPPLMEAFAEGQPAKLWESEPLSTKGGFGYGTVSVVAGRAYTFVHTLYKQPIGERTLPGWAIDRTGYSKNMPEELSAAVEKARLSDERNQLKDGKEIENWINAWLDANVKEEDKRFRGAAQARIRGGKDALPLDVLVKLTTIRDKKFDDQAAFDAWLTENNIDEAARKQINSWVPKDTNVSDDYAYCLDAATGKTLWKTDLDSWFMWYAGSCTPTIVGDKCYLLNSEGCVYCLDTRTGAKLWKSESIGRAGNTHNRSSSPVIVDGVVVVQTAAQAAGFDVETGKILWKERKIRSEYGSAVPWEKAGNKYAVIVGSGKVFCVEPKTGGIVWEVDGSDGPTPTIVGDRMAVCGVKGGVTLYNLAGEKPELLWTVPFDDGFTGPIIHDGHVYLFGEAQTKPGKGRALCIDMATGKTVWSEVVGPPQLSSPIIADGKIIAVGGDTLYLVKATPEKYTELGKVRMGLQSWASPAFADGKVFLKTGKTVVCYDLRKP